MFHLSADIALSLTALALLAFALFSILRTRPAAQSEEQKFAEAAAREFEGAKPALIHACDTAIDTLPDNLDLAGLEAKALIGLTGLLRRLLITNPLLGGAGMLLIGLLPTAFSALPKTVDTTTYKGLLKEEVAKVIGGAHL